jgi:hypothetical protein
LNPHRHFCPQDFKSCVSTNFTTRAFSQCSYSSLTIIFFSYFLPIPIHRDVSTNSPPRHFFSIPRTLFNYNFLQPLRAIPIHRDVSTNFTTRAFLPFQKFPIPLLYLPTPLKNKKCEVNLTLFAPTNHPDLSRRLTYYERETRLELATPTLARSCSTN